MVPARLLQSCLTLCNSMDCSTPGPPVHGSVPWGRILKWVAISSSRGSFWPRDWTCISYVSCSGKWILYQQHHLVSCMHYYFHSLPLSYKKSRLSHHRTFSVPVGVSFPIMLTSNLALWYALAKRNGSTELGLCQLHGEALTTSIWFHQHACSPAMSLTFSG